MTEIEMRAKISPGKIQSSAKAKAAEFGDAEKDSLWKMTMGAVN